MARAWNGHVITFVLPQVVNASLMQKCSAFGRNSAITQACMPRQRYIHTMAATSRRSSHEMIEGVLTHWFGSTIVDKFDPLESQYDVWYKGSQEIDDDIRAKFGEDVEIALQGGWDQLLGTAEHPVTGPLALAIMLDQYTRNIFRGSEKAYAGDEKALQISSRMLVPDKWELAKDQLSAPQLMSFLLPLMHQESLDHLDTCMEKISELREESEAAGDRAAKVTAALVKNLEYAQRHRDIVSKFGRYPYRNDVLGRASTPEEVEFLETGPRFGQ